MKNRRHSPLVALLGLSLLVGGSAARACKYCWSAERAASEYTQQSMLPQGPADNPPGAFPLDSTINQYKPSALAALPPGSAIVTSASDLRPTRVSAPVAVASAVIQSPRAAGHYADAGLLGLAAVGGVFCWRTRRKTGSEC